MKITPVRFTILFFISFAISSGAFAQAKGGCQKMDSLIEKTAQAIITRDAEAYYQLYDVDTFLSVLKEISLTDSAVVEIYNDIKKHAPMLNPVHSDHFREIIKKVNGEGTDKKYKYKSYTITGTDTSLPQMPHYSVTLYFTSGKSNYYADMYVSKYKDCYYIFEPIEKWFSYFIKEEDKR